MAEIGADSFSIFQFNIFVVKSSLTSPSLLVFLFKFSNGFKIESLSCLHCLCSNVSPPRLANGTYLVYPNCCNLLYKVHYCEFGFSTVVRCCPRWKLCEIRQIVEKFIVSLIINWLNSYEDLIFFQVSNKCTINNCYFLYRTLNVSNIVNWKYFYLILNVRRKKQII